MDIKESNEIFPLMKILILVFKLKNAKYQSELSGELRLGVGYG